MTFDLSLLVSISLHPQKINANTDNNILNLPPNLFTPENSFKLINEYCRDLSQSNVNPPIVKFNTYPDTNFQKR
jgi:hypothetical protein